MPAEIKIALDRRRTTNLDDCRQTEWMVTNGRGGYAMATVNQMLTRRYHGLLVAAVNPPLERYLLLAKLDVTATVKGLTYELGTNDYPEAVHPHGYKFLESFSLYPYPTWCWRIGHAVIEQSLCMMEGEDTTFIRFRLIEGTGPVNLSVRPLCTNRHFHHLTHFQDMGPATVEEHGDRLTFSWSGNRPSWTLSHNGSFRSRADWYYHFVLSAEARRGYDSTQDLFMPGILSAELQPGELPGLILAASRHDRSWKTWHLSFESAAVRSSAGASVPACKDALAEALMRPSGDLIVERNEALKTVIAGYPWFGDWGRDTFIALPGLCLVTGRLDDARAIIEAFARHVDRGMIPNCFPNYGDPPEYNTVDATLWYIHAIDRYLAYSRDWAFVAERMFPIIQQILDAHEGGTRHGIRVQDDGLLAAGEPGVGSPGTELEFAL